MKHETKKQGICDKTQEARQETPPRQSKRDTDKQQRKKWHFNYFSTNKKCGFLWLTGPICNIILLSKEIEVRFYVCLAVIFFLGLQGTVYYIQCIDCYIICNYSWCTNQKVWVLWSNGLVACIAPLQQLCPFSNGIEIRIYLCVYCNFFPGWAYRLQCTTVHGFILDILS